MPTFHLAIDEILAEFFGRYLLAVWYIEISGGIRQSLFKVILISILKGVIVQISGQSMLQDAKLFIPPQFRTPVRTHLHTANQRPRVLICIQPIHRGWFNPRYKLVRTTLLLSTAHGVVVRATCIALHYTACSRGVSSNPLAGFFFAIIKWVTMAFIPSEEIPKWWNS